MNTGSRIYGNTGKRIIEAGGENVKKKVATEAKTRTRGVTVKITAMLPRDLWARVRTQAVRRGTTARQLLTEATEAMLTKWEKEGQ